jgi:hypothetical protein
LAKKNNPVAGKIVQKAAKVNGVVLSDVLLSTFDDDETKPRKVSPIRKAGIYKYTVVRRKHYFRGMYKQMPVSQK